MASTVQLKRSSVSGRVPDAANVEVGEPIVNLADQIIFTKDGSGTVKVIGAGTTSNISEGTNLYFTNARARASISVSGAGGSYDSSTGVLTLTLTSFPTGDYGDFTQTVDAFGVSTVVGYDCNAPGSMTYADLGSLS